jgi:hypothetical protein
MQSSKLRLLALAVVSMCNLHAKLKITPFRPPRPRRGQGGRKLLTLAVVSLCNLHAKLKITPAGIGSSLHVFTLQLAFGANSLAAF